MSERKRIGIEALLSWAYRDELPKAQAGDVRAGPKQFGQAWGGVANYGEYLTVIDWPENQWGVVPDLSARSEPHPDAVLVGQCVQELDGLALGLPDDWHPLGDMAGVDGAESLLQGAIGRALADVSVAGREGERQVRSSVSGIVVRQALLGGEPDWRGDVPEVRVESANGKPRWFRRIEVVQSDGTTYEQEVDGYDAKRKRPLAGAYRRTFLDPDPAGVAVERARYEVWHAALDVLCEEIGAIPHLTPEGEPVLDRDGRPVTGLHDYLVEPSRRASRPWMGEGERAGRVLRDAGAPYLRLYRGRWLDDGQTWTLAPSIRAHYAKRHERAA